MTILGRSEELVSRCVECDLAEPESLASLGGSAPGVVDGILSILKAALMGNQTNKLAESHAFHDMEDRGCTAAEDDTHQQPRRKPKPW